MSGLQSRVYRVKGYNKAGEIVSALIVSTDAYRAMADFGGHKIHRPTSCMPVESVHA